MPRRVAGYRNRGVTLTPRLTALAEFLGRWGPLTDGQLRRGLAHLVPQLVHSRSADRLLRRELGRLRGARLLGEQRFPGTAEKVLWLTPAGEELFLGYGVLTESRGDVATPFFGLPAHAKLLKNVALSFYLARLDENLSPRITKLAWEEGVVLHANTDSDGVSVADVEPDAEIWIEVENHPTLMQFLIEADTGQEARRGRWAEKVQNYIHLNMNVDPGDKDNNRGVDTANAGSMTVLVVTPSAVRMRNLAEVTADVLGRRGPAFYFTTPTLWNESVFWAPVWLPAGYGAAPETIPVSLLTTMGQG